MPTLARFDSNEPSSGVGLVFQFFSLLLDSFSLPISIYIYIYIWVCVCVYKYIYIYIYI